MNIETNRLYLKGFEEKYLIDFMSYRNDFDQMKYQGFKGLSFFEYKKALISDKSIVDGKQIAVVNKITNQLIGDLYLKQNGSTLELGYSINKIYYRQGYAFEACCAVIDYATSLMISTIEASVEKENIPSINLLKKLGFLYVETNNNLNVYILRLK